MMLRYDCPFDIAQNFPYEIMNDCLFDMPAQNFRTENLLKQFT